ncbi:MAG: hypothetical protein E6J41_10085 [Chloroflexi bacterium]|nr:MAG: hypothetical protein E6J41_10085 [Chloroflexota bacterium]
MAEAPPQRVHPRARPLRDAAHGGAGRSPAAPAGDRHAGQRGPAHVLDRLPALGLRHAAGRDPLRVRPRAAAEDPLGERARLLRAARARAGRGRLSRLYDVAVVGAGTAGAIVAARLSEDPGRHVVVIEAGPDYPRLEDLPPELRFGQAEGDVIPATHLWDLEGRFTRAQELRPVARGKVVGGSGAVNGQVFLRLRRPLARARRPDAGAALCTRAVAARPGGVPRGRPRPRLPGVRGRQRA